MVVADIRGEAGAMSAPALVESAETAPMRSASGSADAYHGWTEALLYPINVLGDVLLVAALLGELVLVLLNVGARIVIDHSFLWTDEVARFALSILAFVGGAVAYRRHEHAFVRVALNLLPKRGERICLAFADAMVFFVSGITGIASIEFLASSWSERTPNLADARSADRNATTARHGHADAVRLRQAAAQSRQARLLGSTVPRHRAWARCRDPRCLAALSR
jgi:TRAP-type C4-dicarboxylate transport system permease small subunit